MLGKQSHCCAGSVCIASERAHVPISRIEDREKMLHWRVKRRMNGEGDVFGVFSRAITRHCEIWIHHTDSVTHVASTAKTQKSRR